MAREHDLLRSLRRRGAACVDRHTRCKRARRKAARLAHAEHRETRAGDDGKPGRVHCGVAFALEASTWSPITSMPPCARGRAKHARKIKRLLLGGTRR